MTAKEDSDALRNTAYDNCDWVAHTKDRPGFWHRKTEKSEDFAERLREAIDRVNDSTPPKTEKLVDYYSTKLSLEEGPTLRERAAAWASAAPKTEKALAEKTAKAPIAGGVVNRFPRSMHMLAIVSQTGAKKHGVDTGDMTYLDIPDAYATYTDAMIRHVVDEELEGPVNHKDGGLLHPAQVAWNALARLEVFLKNAEEPDAK